MVEVQKDGVLVALLHKLLALTLRSRATVLSCSLISGFDNVHLRVNLSRLLEAIQYGNSAGDRSASSILCNNALLIYYSTYAAFATVGLLETRLYIADHRK